MMPPEQEKAAMIADLERDIHVLEVRMGLVAVNDNFKGWTETPPKPVEVWPPALYIAEGLAFVGLMIAGSAMITVLGAYTGAL